MREVIGYNKNHAERQEDDFYATPKEEVINILSYEYIEGTVLEPCCGLGHMVQGIPKNRKVIATDLIDRGFGKGGLDFLSPEYPYTKDIGTVIMNPPFKLITEFVLRGLEIAENKLIVLARIQFLETIGRYESIFKDNPPNRVYQYIDRISCAKNGDFTKLENSMMYAWFVWDKKTNDKNTYLKWIGRDK